jgi:hypothetical protein
MCFVPSDAVEDIALKNGISKDKITQRGLPIRPKFWKRKSANAKYAYRKGLGLNNGWLVFQDNTSKINLSNVSIELDNRFTVSSGGIYVDGPTTFVVKNYNWRIKNFS